MPLVLNWHPQFALLRSPSEAGAFGVYLDRFARLTRGQLEPLPRIKIHPTAVEVVALVESAPFVAVDIETAPADHRSWTGLDPTRARLKTVGLGTTKAGIAHRWGDNEEVENVIRKVLADPKKPKVFHNGYWFDLRVLSRYGLGVNCVEDTRELRRALSSTSPLNLAYLGSLYTDYFPWKEEDSDDAKGLVFTDDWEKLLTYNAHDTVVTARVWASLSAEAAGDVRVRRLYELHSQLAQLAAEMHTTGFMVDRLNRTFLSWALWQQFKDATRELQALVGLPGWKPTNRNMQALLFRSKATAETSRFNLPDPIDPKAYTKGGDISVDFDSLLSLVTAPGCPSELRQIIEAWWRVNELEKARSTFVSSDKISQAIGDDGRLRAGWNTCGTDTGRWSCNKPNIMTLPQTLRAMYRAAPGNVLVHADKSQLELRVMAAVAPDRELERRLATGDVYTADAIDWFGLPATTTKKTLKPASRRASKIIHLGAQYGAGTKTIFKQALAEDRKIMWRLVEALHNGFKKTYAETVAYWHRELAECKGRGYSETRILQRRRSYPAEPELTETSNYPIQGTAADLMNLEVLALWERLKKEVPEAHLVHQFHDAVDVECPEAAVPEVRRVMEEELQREYTLNGKTHAFPCEFKVATHWDEV